MQRSLSACLPCRLWRRRCVCLCMGALQHACGAMCLHVLLCGWACREVISAVFGTSVRCSISIFACVRGLHPQVRYLDRAPGYCYRESGWNRPGSVRSEVADSHRPTLPVAKRPTYPWSEVRSAQLLGVTLGGFDPSQWSLCTSRIRNCVRYSFKNHRHTP